jgi:uncharacterized repeat protein (TIGR04076 family)
VNTVKATVDAVGGHCPFHKVGDEIVFDGHTIQGHFCASAFVAMMPTMFALRYGASFPWMESRPTFACPDPNNPVVFRFSCVPEPEHT